MPVLPAQVAIDAQRPEVCVRVRNQLGSLLAALTFFTRIPRLNVLTYEASHDRGACVWAPAVGVLVGLAGGAVHGLGLSVLPPTLAVILALTIAVLMTGAMHEDGLADWCDGMGCVGDRQRTLTVMRDPRCGSFAVVGLLLALSAKFFALLELSQAWPAVNGGFDALVPMLAIWIGAHSFSRFLSVSFMWSDDYARTGEDSKAAALSVRMGGQSLAFAAFLGIAPLGLLLLLPNPPASMALLLVPIAVAVLVRQVVGASFRRRLGGYTGDCLGAVQQLTEVAFLVALAAVYA